MKKLYFILFFLISSFLSYGQKYFVGGHGNNEWSNASNWSNGKPNALNAVKLVGNLSRRSSYEYSDAEAQSIIKSLSKAMRDLRKKFK